MRRTLALVVVGLAILLGASPWLTAQSGASALQGAWTVQEVTFPKPTPNAMKKPTGLMLFSGRHFATAAVDAARPAFPEGGAAKATAEQLRATWGPIESEAGTFTVTGDTIRFTRLAAMGPASMAPGNFVDCSFMVKGDTLAVTAVRSQNGPIENPVTVRLTRAK
jgi:hypothetical protein